MKIPLSASSLHRMGIAVAVAAMLSAAGAAAAAPMALPVQEKTEDLTTADGFSRFTTNYYLQPQPERVADAIRALATTGYADKVPRPPTNSPFLGWFAEIFAMNPDRLDAWRKMVAEQQGSARELLDGALNVAAKGGLLKAEASAPLPPTPGMNDWYWSGFFASGNPAYIQRLIDQLRYVDERQNLVLYMTGGSAEWSLASNARQHSRVRNILQEARQRVDARTAALIDELLQRDPQAIRAEMQQTARAIQAATQPH